MTNYADYQIGNICYIADYVKRKKKRNYTYFKEDVYKVLVPKEITPYWFAYLCTIGMAEAVPININDGLLEKIYDLEKCEDVWEISGTKFTLRKFETNYLITADGTKDGGFFVRYMHQLQNAYKMITGIELNVSKALETILPMKLG